MLVLRLDNLGHLYTVHMVNTLLRKRLAAEEDLAGDLIIQAHTGLQAMARQVPAWVTLITDQELERKIYEHR